MLLFLDACLQLLDQSIIFLPFLTGNLELITSLLSGSYAIQQQLETAINLGPLHIHALAEHSQNSFMPFFNFFHDHLLSENLFPEFFSDGSFSPCLAPSTLVLKYF